LTHTVFDPSGMEDRYIQHYGSEYNQSQRTQYEKTTDRHVDKRMRQYQ